jgi:hypothetical protein
MSLAKGKLLLGAAEKQVSRLRDMIRWQTLSRHSK